MNGISSQFTKPLTLTDSQVTCSASELSRANAQNPISFLDCITCSDFTSNFWQKVPFRADRSNQTDNCPVFQREDLEGIITAVAAYSPTDIHLIYRSRNGDVNVN